MAKNNLASMSVEALIKMRDDIGKILSNKAGNNNLPPLAMVVG